MTHRPPDQFYALDDTPALPTSLLLGLQHVAIITISLIFPVVIVRAIGGSPEMAAFFVSMSMLAAGAGTILQALGREGIGSGYMCPSVCGPSYLSASLLAAQAGGLHLLFGMTAIAGSFEVLFSRIIHRLQVLFPTEVTGVVVTMVGIAVIPVAVPSFFGISGADTTADLSEVAVGLISLGVMIGANVWSHGRLKLYTVLVGMVTGYVMAAALGLLTFQDASQIMNAPFIAFPDFGYFGWSFDLLLVIPFFIAIICSSLKSVGDISTCQKVNTPDWKRPDMENISGGIFADGLSSMVAGFVGGMGQSTSSSNIGLSIATGATSRAIAFSTGAILLLLAFFPKLAQVFAIMPAPVMGATLIFAVSYMIITGLQIIMSRMMDARKIFLVGISFIFGLSVDIFPDIYQSFHPWIQPVFSSSLSLATILAISLNLIMRIGIAKSQELVLRTSSNFSDEIFTFFEEQGAAWGARRDVIQRAIQGMNEFMETAVHLDIRDEITALVSFDEFNLDAQITYRGEPFEIPQTAPSQEELIMDDDAFARLSAFLIRKYTDSVTIEPDGEFCRVNMHFAH